MRDLRRLQPEDNPWCQAAQDAGSAVLITLILFSWLWLVLWV